MAENNLHTSIESLFKGMDSFISTKTVVGDAIHIGDTILLPLVDVSFGLAAGAFSSGSKNNGGGGMGGKITPSAVLVIQGDKTKLVNVRNQEGITKILDMVPDFVDRFSNRKKKKDEDNGEKKQQDPQAQEAAKEELNDMLTEAVQDKE